MCSVMNDDEQDWPKGKERPKESGGKTVERIKYANDKLVIYHMVCSLSAWKLLPFIAGCSCYSFYDLNAQMVTIIRVAV